MPNRPALPAAEAAALDALLKQSGEADRAGDVARSTQLCRQAWENLPEPKASWDFYPQIIARGVLENAVATRNRDEIEVWLQKTYETYGAPDHDDHFVNMLEGTAWREIGDDDRAYAVFAKIHTRDGRAGFSGENLRHLEWYLKERARRRG